MAAVNPNKLKNSIKDDKSRSKKAGLSEAEENRLI
jgi:hypothetical protein